MISALSGSTSAQLLALFARPQTQTTSGSTTKTAQRPPQPPPGPPPAGNGASAQSVFDALVGGGNTPATAANPLDDLMARLLKTLETDGDGKLSAAELKSAVANLQGNSSGAASASSASGTGSASAMTDATTTSATATGAGGAKSLYQSLFDAMASMTASRDNTNQLRDVSQKYLTALSA